MQMGKHVALPNESGAPTETTLLELVQWFVQEDCSEREIVAVVLDLVGNGDVVLTGNFRGQRLEGDA